MYWQIVFVCKSNKLDVYSNTTTIVVYNAYGDIGKHIMDFKKVGILLNNARSETLMLNVNNFEL